MGLIGKVIDSKNYGKFEVLNQQEKRVNRIYLKVRFLETGYEVFSSKKHIRSGNIKDRLCKIVYGVGCIGKANKIDNKKEYNTWSSMLGRCYDQNNTAYNRYGGIGVKVCDSWHNFTNFLNDIKFLENWDKEKFENGEITLDKDKLQYDLPVGERIYSKDTCCWLSYQEQTNYKKNQTEFKAINPNGDIYFARNRKKFANKHNLDAPHISSCLNGNLKHHKGWKFELLHIDDLRPVREKG